MGTMSTHLDWSVHIWLFNTQHNLSGDGDSVEEVVDEADVVDESVHVTGAQHKQGGQALQKKKEKKVRHRLFVMSIKIKVMEAT